MSEFEDQRKLEEQFIELLAMEKAHLPEFPRAPKQPRSPRPKVMREGVVRDLEERVRQFVEEYVTRPGERLADVKQAFDEKVKEVAADLEATAYETEQAKWLVYKQQSLEQADETSIYRWDNEVSKIYRLSPPNQGKAITDQNPYVHLLDIEEFDVASEVYPYDEAPPTWDKELYFKFFTTMHEEVSGRADTFLGQIMRDQQRMADEARGTVEPPVAREQDRDLAKLKEDIRAYASSLGFAAMGVTKLDRRYIAGNMDGELPYNTLILLAHEMPIKEFIKIPVDNPLMAFTSYRDGGQAIHQVADFIRSRGYRCLARVSSDGAVKYAPHAVNAGMGNYSTFGICITPEVGMRTKMAGILIDAELPIDRPRDLNIEEFCSRCRCCQKTCPAGAIPKDEKPFRGTLKRQTYHQRCFEYMATSYECNLCTRICPFSTLGHERAMGALPRYLHYNLFRDEMDVELVRLPWDGGGT